MVKIGFIGAGYIANIMGKTLEHMDCVERYAVAARNLNRARIFADQHGFAKAYGSYEEMLEDPEVDLVYIATPHSHHYEHIKMCLEHGKHVLCEKAFTINASQGEEVLQMAKEKKLLLAEAIWTRYMPMRRRLDELLAEGAIGAPQMLTANLCYLVSHKERLQNPDLAGGALLDLGIYALNFASMVFGNDIKEITSSAVLTDKGVDAQNSITLVYQDGKMAVLNSSMIGLSDRRGIIYGDRGFIEVDNINNYEGIRVYDKNRELAASYVTPEQITGYEYEVEACVKAIEAGELECADMPHEEILRMLVLMDELRQQWGMHYPGE